MTEHKRLFPLITGNISDLSDDYRQIISELHNELKKDGFVYVECNEEICNNLTRLQEISKVFFHLSSQQKSSFHSYDIMQKKLKEKNYRKQRQKRNANGYVCESSVPVGFSTDIHGVYDNQDCYWDNQENQRGISFVNCGWTASQSLWWRRIFFSWFSSSRVSTPSQSSSNPVEGLDQSRRLPNSQDFGAFLNGNSISNLPTLSNHQPVLFHAGALAPVRSKKNTAVGKGYFHKEINPFREFYDIEENDIFLHKEFSEITNICFQCFRKYCILFLKQILFPLQIENGEYLDSLIHGRSHSKLRLIRYNFQGTRSLSFSFLLLLSISSLFHSLFRSSHWSLVGECSEETCIRHTDMGLLTFAPALSSGLELKSFHEPYSFIDIEKESPCKPCLIVFAGEALARLTGGYFKAPIHRVSSVETRYSFPFFFRSTAEVVLDIKQLTSPVLEEMLKNGDVECLEGITANELEIITQEQYRTKKIPVELGNYKQHLYYQQLFD
jgi:isopenicillin N synthase-like dioxygenase